MAASLAIIEPWEIRAPLGRPVVPDVYTTVAILEGVGGFKINKNSKLVNKKAELIAINLL